MSARRPAVGNQLGERGVDRVGDFGVPRHEDGGATRAVLGLRQEIGGDELGRRARVGHDHHLGRSRQRIDADHAGDLTLGGGDVRVAGPDDDVDRPDGLGAVCERGDGLGAADPEHLVDAHQRGRREGGLGDQTVRTGRHAQDDLGHSGHLGGNGRHQHGGRVRRATARNVEAGAVDRACDLLELDPGARRGAGPAGAGARGRRGSRRLRTRARRGTPAPRVAVRRPARLAAPGIRRRGSRRSAR